MADIKFSLLLIILAAGMAFAGKPTAPITVVSGYILTSGNETSIPDADVAGACIEGSTIIDTFSTKSGGSGHYNQPIRCPIGATVQVNATKNGNAASSSSTVVQGDGNGATHTDIDVHLTEDVQIPEFPTAAAPVLLSMLSFGLVRLRKR